MLIRNLLKIISLFAGKYDFLQQNRLENYVCNRTGWQKIWIPPLGRSCLKKVGAPDVPYCTGIPLSCTSTISHADCHSDIL